MPCFRLILAILTEVMVIKTVTSLGFCYNKTLNVETDGFPIRNTISSLTQSNNADCARACAYLDECMAFFVNAEIGNCLLLSRPINDLLLIDKAEWKGFAFEDPSRIPAAEEQPLELWISAVTDYLSQYGDANAATTIIGPPQVYPSHGDIPGAWAARYWSHGPQWIKVQISQRLYIIRIDLYETFNPGGTEKISAKNPENGIWYVVWTTPQLTHLTTSRINSIDVQILFATDELMITIDGVVAQYWVEIDAVKVIGFPS